MESNKTDVIKPSKGGILNRNIQLCTGLFRSPSVVGKRYVESGSNTASILFILLKGILVSGILFIIYKGRLEVYVEDNSFQVSTISTPEYLIQIKLLSAIILLCVILYSFSSALLYWLIYKFFAKTPITYGQMLRAISGKSYYLIPVLIISMLLLTISQTLNEDLSLTVIHKVLFIIALFLIIIGIVLGNMSFDLWIKETTGISSNKFIYFSVIVKTILSIIMSIFIYFLIHYYFLGLFTEIYMFFRYL